MPSKELAPLTSTDDLPRTLGLAVHCARHILSCTTGQEVPLRKMIGRFCKDEGYNMEPEDFTIIIGASYCHLYLTCHYNTHGMKCLARDFRALCTEDSDLPISLCYP